MQSNADVSSLLPALLHYCTPSVTLLTTSSAEETRVRAEVLLQCTQALLWRRPLPITSSTTVSSHTTWQETMLHLVARLLLLETPVSQATAAADNDNDNVARQAQVN